MKAGGILLVVKYLRTVSRQLGSMTLSSPDSLHAGYPPNYCGLVRASPHLTVLAFSSHRISSSRSNRMHRGDTACQGDPKNTTGKTGWLEITKVEIIYILTQDHFSDLILFRSSTKENMPPASQTQTLKTDDGFTVITTVKHTCDFSRTDYIN